jgi:hypothetical protein
LTVLQEQEDVVDADLGGPNDADDEKGSGGASQVVIDIDVA